MRKIFLFVNVFFCLLNQIKSQDTVLFATYNLLRFDSETDRNTHFKKVTDYINADVYITQEFSNEGGVNNFLDKRKKHIHWNGTDQNGKSVSAGTYFLRVSNKDASITKKIVYLK